MARPLRIEYPGAGWDWGRIFLFDKSKTNSGDWGRIFRFDKSEQRDELTSITKPDASVVSFTYNAQGRRASKTAGGTVTNYLYDGNKLIAEKDGSGTLIASYIYDDGSTSLTTGKPVSVNRGGQNYYYHFNAHGDPPANV